MDKNLAKKEYFSILQKRKKRNFFGHLGIFVLINTLLFFTNIFTIIASREFTLESIWFLWPLLGLGIGIFLHALETFKNPDESMRLKELEMELGIKSKEY